MGFNDQVRNMAYGSDSKKFIFLEGVRHKKMSGKNPTVFRILPAFDPANADAGTSWLPFCLPNGDLTDWGRAVKLIRYVGHGQNRKDFISLKSFNKDAQDPLEILTQTAKALPEWNYLTVDVGEGRGQIRKSLPSAGEHLLLNIWDINQASQEVVIGVLSTSAAKALIDGKKGLAYQRNTLPPEIIQQNYLMQYAVGDLTHPINGPAVCCAKGTDKGEKSDFQVYLATDAANRVITRQLNQEQMRQRYDLARPETFLDIPTEEEIIKQLISIFCLRSPAGYHEYALLKQAFPAFPIPEPPSAPASSSTIQAGFGVNPAAQRPQAQTSTPMPTFTNTPIPVNTMIGGTPSVPGMGFQQNSMNTQIPSAAAPVSQGTPIPMGPGPQAQAPTAAPVPEAARAAANMAAAQIPSAAAPVVPGDAIPTGTTGANFSKEAFLARLSGGIK